MKLKIANKLLIMPGHNVKALKRPKLKFSLWKRHASLAEILRCRVGILDFRLDFDGQLILTCRLSQILDFLTEFLVFPFCFSGIAELLLFNIVLSF